MEEYYIKSKQGWYIAKGGIPPRIQLLTGKTHAHKFTKEKAQEVIAALNKDTAIAEQLQLHTIKADGSIINFGHTW